MEAYYTIQLTQSSLIALRKSEIGRTKLERLDNFL